MVRRKKELRLRELHRSLPPGPDGKVAPLSTLYKLLVERRIASRQVPRGRTQTTFLVGSSEAKAVRAAAKAGRLYESFPPLAERPVEEASAGASS